MSLLLLFHGAAGPPFADSFSALVQQAPAAGYGYPTQVDTPAGVWRFAVQLADPLAGDEIQWHDVTRFYLGDRYQRGADTYKGKARASQAIVDLQIDNLLAANLGVDINILAPWGQDTTPLFGVDIELDAGLLMRATMALVVDGTVTEWHPIWTGRVETWGDASNARGQIRRHQITVGDLMSDLVNVPIQFDIGGGVGAAWNDWFEDFLLPPANWLFGVDIYGDTGSPDLPVDEDEVHASALALMDQGTEPLGLVWRTLRSGRMVIHPAPWDTTMTNRYENPLLDVYPEGVRFSYAPDTSDVEYVADDDLASFGLPRTSLGVTNSIVVTSPGPVTYPIDSATSIQKYGYKPLALSWILANDPAADDLLDDRAFASVQALPLQTTLDHEGFWTALLLLDHLDPVTVIHATAEDAATVTATGTIRNIVEERTFRTPGALSWQSTVQIDVDSATPSEALLPVENLSVIGDPGPSSAVFGWTNPLQPHITPTEVQVRLVGRSLVWYSIDYPGDETSQFHSAFGLNPSTAYMLQVRLVRRVFGVVTHASAIRAVRFVTAAPTAPVFVPGDDPGDTGFDAPPPEGECDDFTVELQESPDGFTWTTIDTFSGTELELGDDGLYHPAVDIDNSVFDDDKVYRLRSTCDGITFVNGPTTDPPDSWLDPCTDPPALANTPFVDAIVYVPKICAPDTIKEAVSGIAGVHGDAYAGLGVLSDDPNYRTLIAIDQPDWDDATGGIVAYGESPQTFNVTGDKSVSCRISIPDAEACVLWENCAMSLACVPTTAGYRVAVTVNLANGSTVTLTTASVLTEGTEYFIGATRDLETGDIKIYVDGGLDNSVGGTDNIATIHALPIWRAGVPPGGWITDCATWDRVVTDWGISAAPSVTINQGASQADPTGSSPIVFDVVFSEAVTGFATGDVTLSGTAGATTATVTNTGDDIHYTVSVTGMTEGGTVTASIAANVCTSIATSLPNAASTSTDNTVTYLAPIFGTWAHSVGSGSAPSSTLFWPEPPEVGDIALLYFTRSNTAAYPTITDFGSPAHSGSQGAVYTRVVDGSETLSGYTLAPGSSMKHCSIIILLKGLSSLAEVGFATQTGTSSPTDITYPTITPTNQPSLIFYTGHAAEYSSGTPVNPGGSNPTPTLVTDSGVPPGAAICRCVIWYGRCTSTSALGNRTVAETGLDTNVYHGMTLGIREL